MIWDDSGYLISKNKFSENSIIAEFFTKNHGKYTSVIYGATSKKIKNYLMIGNKFRINFTSKNNGKNGYFKVEIEKITTPIFLENNIKLLCILYSMNLIKILTVENQVNLNIYILIDKLFQILQSNNWIKNFVFWELNIFKNLGYDINFKNYAYDKIVNGTKSYFVKSTTDNRKIPNFLIDINNESTSNDDLLNGLKIVGDFFEKTILKPNNLNYPITRIEFIKSLVK